MSGSGTPALQVEGAQDLRVAVVAAQWHAQVMDGLLEGAQRAPRRKKLGDGAVWGHRTYQHIRN